MCCIHHGMTTNTPQQRCVVRHFCFMMSNSWVLQNLVVLFLYCACLSLYRCFLSYRLDEAIASWKQ